VRVWVREREGGREREREEHMQLAEVWLRERGSVHLGSLVGSKDHGGPNPCLLSPSFADSEHSSLPRPLSSSSTYDESVLASIGASRARLMHTRAHARTDVLGIGVGDYYSSLAPSLAGTARDLRLAM
jgi:hypothetical protein